MTNFTDQTDNRPVVDALDLLKNAKPMIMNIPAGLNGADQAKLVKMAVSDMAALSNLSQTTATKVIGETTAAINLATNPGSSTN